MPFIIISAVVAILVAILAIQNSMMVDLHSGGAGEAGCAEDARRFIW